MSTSATSGRASDQFDTLFSAAHTATLIDEGVTIIGDIINTSPNKVLVIAGQVKGRIDSKGPVKIEKTGRLEGSLRALRAQVDGKIEGVKSEDGIEIETLLVLTRSGRLQCDSVYGDFKESDGEMVSGFKAEHGAMIAATIVPASMAEEMVSKGHLKFWSSRPEPLVASEELAAPVASIETAKSARSSIAAGGVFGKDARDSSDTSFLSIPPLRAVPTEGESSMALAG